VSGVRQVGGVFAAALLAVSWSGCTWQVREAYTVAASVQVDTHLAVTACYFYTLQYPAAPCSGVPLTNVNVRSLPVAEMLRDGTRWSPILELTGVWTGSALALTSPPVPAAAATPLPTPPHTDYTRATQPTEQFYRDQSRLNRDWERLRTNGIWMMENGWDGWGLEIVVAAADHQTIDYLRKTYGAEWVGSWFRLVN
jgi:hypothetical protein